VRNRERKTISLVLGSGGARGHAHLGVIKAIEERGLEIRNIAGTSMGSLIGGIYAAGKLDTYTDWVRQLSRRDVVRMLDFSFNWSSLFKGERIFEVLRELVGDSRIEDLPKGFTAVATAIDEQREVWFNKGSLFQAIRASSAVPGVFAPVRIGDRILVDGGLVNPIPIAPTLNDDTDLTIAVNLSAIEERYNEPMAQEEPAGREGFLATIGETLDDLLGNDDAEKTPDAAELLTSSIDVMQGAIARLKLAAYTPDKVVDIPRDACTFFEFHRAAEMSELGYDRTRKALGQLGL
jgi:NTE family protein